jgi:hypothetical protein
MKGRLQQDMDWKDIHKRMEALLAEFPQLNEGWRGEYFKDLTATVSAPPPKPGSTEALLLEWASHRSERGDRFGQGEEGDAPEREIVRRGYDAIPDLIALLDDRRVTAHEHPGFMNAPPRMLCIGDLARTLLYEIVGPQSDVDLYHGDSKAIRPWWEQFRGKHEANFLKETIFNRKGDKIIGVNENTAHAMADKYPQELPPLCDEFSKHATPEASPFALAEAASKLSQETRLRVLTQFAQRGPLDHKRSVLQVLVKVNPHACAEILLPLVRQLPRDSEGPYWTCPVAFLALVVANLDDDAVWREYLAAARRSTVGLRMEMMSQMTYTALGSTNRGRRLAFIAAFLQDDALREIPDSFERGKFEGPCAGFTILRLHVRDLAAMQIAAMLGLHESPDEFWTQSQWENLREKVQRKLAEEKLPNL